MINTSLEHRLKKLRLSGLAGSLDARLQEAASNRLSHLEFLEIVLQDEELIRHDRQLARRTQQAGFREQRRLEDFDWRFNPGIKRKAIYDLAAGRYIEQARDVLFIGPPGVGKSHLAQALGHQAILQGRSVRYGIFSSVPSCRTLGEGNAPSFWALPLSVFGP